MKTKRREAGDRYYEITNVEKGHTWCPRVEDSIQNLCGTVIQITEVGMIVYYVRCVQENKGHFLHVGDKVAIGIDGLRLRPLSLKEMEKLNAPTPQG